MKNAYIKNGTTNTLSASRPTVSIELETDSSEAFCCFCNKHQARSNFYPTDNPKIKSHLFPICRSCAKEIAEQTGVEGSPGMTKESLCMVLRYIDRPFFTIKFEAAMQETKAAEEKKEDAGKAGAFGRYLRLLNSDPSTRTMKWDDGEEGLRGGTRESDDGTSIYRETFINQKDVVRLMGYDPYANEPEIDRPLLYSKTVGFLDASPEANEDELKLSSIIEIVKLFNQAEKINTAITSLSATKYDIADNAATIRALESTKKDILSNALSLAKDNGISAAHNTKKSKGSSTFTGLSKKMNEMNLREHQVNSFDIETAAGFEQVAELSTKAILKQIALDENDYSEMIVEQHKLIDKWRKTAAKAVEQARILLQENVDLKNSLLKYDAEVVLANSIELDTEGGVNDTKMITEKMIEEAKGLSDDVLEDDVIDFSDNGDGDDNG